MTGVSIPDVLSRLVRRQDLDDSATAAVMRRVMEGEVPATQLAGFLLALRTKGETAAEVAGLVRGMREYARSVHVDVPVVDTCGTGGDRAGTFNVSTVAAIVTAAAGAPVAKHGNRAASGRCGSADLLESYGVVLDLSPAAVAACIRQVGIGFCFAPSFHPAMRHAMPARRELGVPTVFNFLGPLTNPAGARHQTIGVSDPVMAPRMAEVLARLGTDHALVFHGTDGLDELTTTGPSQVWEIRGADVSAYPFDPLDYGIERATRADLQGGDVADNRRIADEVLAGRPGPARDIVVLGAAAALVAADRHEGWPAALDAAREAIDSGRAGALVPRWAALTRKLA